MTLQASLDRANPNTLPDQFRKIKIGQTLRQDVKTTRRKLNPDAAATNPEDLATLDSIVLPDNAKAAFILRAYGRTGTAGTGEMTVAARHAVPTTGQVAISPAGNLVFLPADILLDVDVEYLAERGDVFETADLPVVSDVLTLPTALTTKGVLVLLEANVKVGGVTGRKIILTPGGTPATGQAALDVAKTQVDFFAGDATSASVKVLIVADADLDALLESADDETV